MNIETELIFVYENNNYATIAYNSLNPDNEDYVYSYINNNKLICNIKSSKLSTTLATIEDLIHCEGIIEKTFKIKK
ncbi:MAG: KEOPS complex subunit Pcc1 [Methanobacteriaceae archaeon]|nr:KEOPS complex subunit Pcc1 [Methanobacteriaceae archaeon]